MTWHVHKRPTLPRQSIVGLVSSTTPIDALHVLNLNVWRLGHQPRLRLLTVTQRTPAVAPQKSCGGRKAYSSNSAIALTQVTGKLNQDTEDSLTIAIATSPSLFCARLVRFLLHPPETFRVIASYSSPPQEHMILAATRTRRRVPSLSSTVVSVCIWRRDV